MTKLPLPVPSELFPIYDNVAKFFCGKRNHRLAKTASCDGECATNGSSKTNFCGSKLLLRLLHGTGRRVFGTVTAVAVVAKPGKVSQWA